MLYCNKYFSKKYTICNRNKNINYLGINLTIGVQALCGENDKALLEDTKENLNSWKDILCTCREGLDIVKMSIFSKPWCWAKGDDRVLDAWSCQSLFCLPTSGAGWVGQPLVVLPSSPEIPASSWGGLLTLEITSLNPMCPPPLLLFLVSLEDSFSPAQPFAGLSTDGEVHSEITLTISERRQPSTPHPTQQLLVSTLLEGVLLWPWPLRILPLPPSPTRLAVTALMLRPHGLRVGKPYPVWPSSPQLGT